jgi:N,N'-diacetylchitobiose transport system permease protein
VRRSLAGRITFNTIALILAVVFIFPVYWMIVTALTPAKDLFSKNPSFFPVHATFAHFKTVTGVQYFGDFWVNSLTATVGAVLLSLVIALMAAVAVARMRFRGRKSFILMIMIAQMAPWAVLQISVYMIVRNNNMLNEILPLLLFYMAMILPFTIWTLRNFVAAIPKELEESALIDGCNRVQAFWRVIFPLLAPGLMATSLFGFITAWGVPAGAGAGAGLPALHPGAVADLVPDPVRQRLGRHHGRRHPVRDSGARAVRHHAAPGGRRPDRRRGEGLTRE